MKNVKPCPFCGSEGIAKKIGVRGWNLWIVGCDGTYGSGCPGYAWKCTPVYFTKETAIKAWNRRSSGQVVKRK